MKGVRTKRLILLLILLLGPTTLAQPITLEHAAGVTELDAPAVRVVALEWTYAEDLVAIGVQPIGVADIAGYQAWVNVEPQLADSVVDVGTRQEPSLETILSLEPDLIIGVRFRHEPILDQLEAIAPTLLFNPYPGPDGPDQLGEMQMTFRTIASAVGRATEAESVLANMQATFEKVRDDLDAGGKVGNEVLLVQAFTSQNSPQLRVFTDNAMAVGILKAIGLENAWPSEYAQYGFDTVEVEALAPVENADAFFYVVQANDDVFAAQLANNPIWQNLGFVKEARTYPLGGDTWLFGGPLSAARLASQIGSLLSD